MTFEYAPAPESRSIVSINPKNKPNNVALPGLFIQDEIKMNCNHKLLLGFRYDYNEAHGNIYTPRLAYKLTLNPKNILRLNLACLGRLKLYINYTKKLIHLGSGMKQFLMKLKKKD
jgi:hypothetical protein